MKKKKLKLNIIEHPKSLATSFVINLKDLNKEHKRKASTSSLFNKKKLEINFAFKIKKSLAYFKLNFTKRRSNKKFWEQKIKNFSNIINKDKRDYRQEVVWHKSILSFILILILLIVPFKFLTYLKVFDISALENRVFSHSQAAFNNLLLATNSVKSLDLNEASDNFSSASSDFTQASLEIEKFNLLLTNLAKYSNDPKLKLASVAPYFLEAGKNTANLGSYLSLAFESVLNDDKNWEEKIKSFFTFSNLALNEVLHLNKVLAKIDPNLIPDEHQPTYLFYQKTAEGIQDTLVSINNLQDSFFTIFGLDKKQRYLLVFQNNYEIRGSGGFMGSYALVDMLNGEIVNLEVPTGGTYDTEAGMTSFISSPQALHLVNPRWYFWDANWWPDWPTSAKNIMWLYEKSNGPSVDGVIGFNLPVLETLLQITGPIDLEAEYGLTIDHQNFWLLLQKTVEKKNVVVSHLEEVFNIPNSPDNEPKQIIADLMTEILAILPERLNMDTLAFLLQSLDTHLNSKDILVFLTNNEVQEKIREIGLEASISETAYDYLMIANSNIAGQKTDKVMEEKVFLDTKVLSDGRIINELTIAKKHTGFKNDIFTGVRNVNWLRVYVPLGSQLISATGFKQPAEEFFSYPESDWEQNSLVQEGEGQANIDHQSQTLIYKEFNKTVFANWTMTDPQEHSVIKIKYELPFRFQHLKKASNWWQDLKSKEADKNYFHSLLIQKQPGSKNFQLYARLRLDGNWRINWSYPENMSNSQAAWLIDELIKQDKIWALTAQAN